MFSLDHNQPNTAVEVLDYAIDRGWTTRKEIQQVLKLSKTEVAAWFEAGSKRRPTFERMSALAAGLSDPRAGDAISNAFNGGSKIVCFRTDVGSDDENGDGVVNAEDAFCKLLAGVDELTTEIRKQYKSVKKGGEAPTESQAIAFKQRMVEVARMSLAAARIYWMEAEKAVRK